jgi:hypothetical protein
LFFCGSCPFNSNEFKVRTWISMCCPPYEAGQVLFWWCETNHFH